MSLRVSVSIHCTCGYLCLLKMRLVRRFDAENKTVGKWWTYTYNIILWLLNLSVNGESERGKKQLFLEIEEVVILISLLVVIRMELDLCVWLCGVAWWEKSKGRWRSCFQYPFDIDVTCAVLYLSWENERIIMLISVGFSGIGVCVLFLPLTSVITHALPCVGVRKGRSKFVRKAPY